MHRYKIYRCTMSKSYISIPVCMHLEYIGVCVHTRCIGQTERSSDHLFPSGLHLSSSNNTVTAPSYLTQSGRIQQGQVGREIL